MDFNNNNNNKNNMYGANMTTDNISYEYIIENMGLQYIDCNKRANLIIVLIPEDYKKDLAEIPKKILDEIEIVAVKTVDEVLKIALTKELKPIEWIEVENLPKSKTDEKSSTLTN